MGWQDHLQIKEELLSIPWVGGRSLQTKNRTWKIKGTLPSEHGWYTFYVKNRIANLKSESDSNEEIFYEYITGYLVGGRLVTDDTQTKFSIEEMSSNFEFVYLIQPGIERFSRIKVGRIYENGPLIFVGEEFPLGPEDEVLNSFLDQKDNVDDISEVTPALDIAFKFENYIRIKIENQRKAQEEKIRQEALQKQMRDSFGTGLIRRQIAVTDFRQAAVAALSLGGAVYLDHRKGIRNQEMIVKYKFNNIRLECVCHSTTLRIIDSGVCLQEHDYDNDFEVGTKGDTWLTLESIPGVIKEAIDKDVLVIYRRG